MWRPGPHLHVEKDEDGGNRDGGRNDLFGVPAPAPRQTPVRRPDPVRALIVALVMVLASIACSSEPPIELSADGARGRDIANANGCAACHGKNGQGTTGPSWQGLYLSEVELDDGTVVVADDDYLWRSIAEPDAELVAGFNIKMPKKDLNDTQIAAILDYIRELQ